MKFRPQRGGLAEAMTECVEIEPTLDALRKHITATNANVLPESVEVARYMDGPDTRIGWGKTFIVIATWIDGGRSPVGYTDQYPTVASPD